MSAIAEASTRCMLSFHLLVSKLIVSTPKYQDLMPPVAIKSEEGRFRVWCGSLGAVQKGHASLDFRLREWSIMQDNVLDLLKRLHDNLVESISVVSEARLPYEEQTTPDDLDEDEFSDSSSENGESHEQRTELQMRLSSIRGILDFLYKLSFEIRSPAPRPRSSKATLYRELVKVDDGNSDRTVVESISMHEETRYKISNWLDLLEEPEIGAEAPESRVSGTERTASPPKAPASEGFPAIQKGYIDILDVYMRFDRLHMLELFWSFGIDLTLPDAPPESKTLYERLTQAITERRRRFRYWSQHTENVGAGPSTAVVRLGVPQQARKVKSPTGSHAQAAKPSASQSAPAVTPHSVHFATEVTATYDKKLDDELASQSATSVASTTWDVHRRGLKFPSAPQAAAVGNDFICPYCSVLCPAKHGVGRSWRAHVLQDLQAYICTYNDCTEANRVYSSRSQWAEHEARSHRRAWRCYRHSDAVFRSPELLANHLRTQHAGILKEVQISSLVEVAAISLIDDPTVCPICLLRGPFEKGLQSHLANHLERIALFSLPRSFGEEAKSSNSSSNAPQASAQTGTTLRSETIPSSGHTSGPDEEDEVILLEEHGTDLKEEDAEKMLLRAARKGYEAVVKLLLGQGGINVDPLDKRRRTPLFLAAMNGHEAVVRLLLARAVDVNARDWSGDTPLSLAAANGHEAVVRLLLAREDININSKDIDSETPLILAIRNGHETVAKLLLDREDINMHIRNCGGQTPLSVAAMWGHEELVRTLLARDDVNVNHQDYGGFTSLYRAAELGYEGIVKLLLAHKDIDVNIADDQGRTPLIRADEREKERTVALLQSYISRS